MDKELPQFDEASRRFWDQNNGRLRGEFYRNAIQKANNAIEDGYWIEAIAIYESLLSDRLEARLQYKLKNHKLKIRTVGSACGALLNCESKINNPTLYKLCEDILKWSKGRNSAVHHLVKLANEHEDVTFNQRYEQFEIVAKMGKSLFDKLKKEMRIIFKQSIKKKKKKK